RDLTSAERRIWGIGMANKLRLLIGYPIDDERNPGESAYDSEQIKKGASWALNFAREEGLAIALVVNVLRDLTHTPEFSGVFGVQWVSRIAKTSKGMLNGSPVFVVTPQKRTMQHTSVALHLWPEQSTIASVY